MFFSKGKKIKDMGNYSVSLQKSICLTALYPLKREFVLMGMVCWWAVWEQVQYFMFDSKKHKKAQLPEVGPPVPVWNKHKVVWFSKVGTNLALSSTGQNVTALSTDKMFVPSQSVIWIAVHISHMSVYTYSSWDCKIKGYWLCSTGINARKESFYALCAFLMAQAGQDLFLMPLPGCLYLSSTLEQCKAC